MKKPVEIPGFLVFDALLGMIAAFFVIRVKKE